MSRKTFLPRLNYWTDVTAVAAATMVFATGLILLLRFHAGPGSLRTSDLGMTRLAWANLHRVAACITLAAALVHIQIHWRTIVIRVSRIGRRLSGAATVTDMVLYFGFVVASLTALVAWFAAPGSPPLTEPFALGDATPDRRHWIDLHHFAGLILLPATVIHIRRHLTWLLHNAAR